MRDRLSRFAGWLVTSPAAFFAGFVLELLEYWWGVLGGRLRAGRRALRRRPRAS